mmetsp:Transcript_24746/g.83175  ORF Transcript_24746/g.83175 Transcript_24746/m.83175 type:complete len:226 (-) Transcript_24746:464-1141(-)
MASRARSQVRARASSRSQTSPPRCSNACPNLQRRLSRPGSRTSRSCPRTCAPKSSAPRGTHTRPRCPLKRQALMRCQIYNAVSGSSRPASEPARPRALKVPRARLQKAMEEKATSASPASKAAAAPASVEAAAAARATYENPSAAGSPSARARRGIKRLWRGRRVVRCLVSRGRSLVGKARSTASLKKKAAARTAALKVALIMLWKGPVSPCLESFPAQLRPLVS